VWAIVERGRALSSLTTEDAIAYRAFLRHPSPRARWVGPVRPRTSPDWRPFNGSLSARSVAHALSILGALFRWLIEQRYVLANPFAGVKVREASGVNVLDTSHAFSEGEWALVRTIADGLEWSHGWSAPAAQRLRFLLDFGYATGLRASELVGATLGHIETDARGDHWLYMNASRLRQFFACSDINRMGHSCISVHGLPPMSKIGVHFEGLDCVRTFGF
jgi:integrase